MTTMMSLPPPSVPPPDRPDRPAADDLHLVRLVLGLTADSREVRSGWLFAALPGARTDGRRFIPDAIRRGARVILAHPDTVLPDDAGDDVMLVTDANPRHRFARLAAAFHGRQPAMIAAVTGTNGKTSTVQFARQIWQSEGLSAASLGTLGLCAPGLPAIGTLTTPDPLVLHAALADLVDARVTHLAMEASSHGLDQHRLDGVRVRVAAFTNLSRDHLDYHGTMAAYWAAKRRLFTELLEPTGTAVINADADQAAELIAACTARGQQVLSCGRAGRDITLVSVNPQLDGLHLRLVVLGRSYDVRLPLVGLFQADNALCALGIAIASGSDPARAVGALEGLTGVRGRLEQVAVHPAGAPVFVDYAHTPDALTTVLTALRPHVDGRLVVVFGCGGDRDPGKRPQMGAAVQGLADLAIVTDDNPRTEDPAAIRAAVLAAAPGALEVGDRAEAIRHAVGQLRGGDILVVAGKGHEQGQIVGAEVRPFDDATQARHAVAALTKGEGS